MKRKSKIKLKPSRLVFLIVLVAANTFAWFIYATRVDTNIDVHVKSWNVTFEAGQNEVTNIVNIAVDDIYPGMTNYSYAITAYNRSEVPATLSFTILEARVLFDRYVTTEGRALSHEQSQVGDLSSAQLQTKLATDYPFTITLGLSGTSIQQGNGTQTFNIGVVWPYENNHDDIDTYWGTQAHAYKTAYPTNSSITIKVKLTITQASS